MPHILDEAERCLQCRKPRCRSGCPIHNPIPQFIQLLIDGRIKEAGNLVFTNNPLSIVCSLVCPHEEFCEGHCIRTVKSTAVQISSIEQYIADYNLDLLDLYSTKEYEGKVAIVGGGPAGVAMAFFMARRGYEVVIYESEPEIGGVMRYGIPDFRQPNRDLDRLADKLRQIGVTIHPNTVVGPVLTLADMFRDGFDAIFMSTGVWKPNKLNLKGESLGNVHYAINYLKSPAAYRLGRSVVVIGAGNVAMDAARTAIRSQVRQVTVMYRKTEADMPARKMEYEYTRMDGVEFEFQKVPVEFTSEGVYYRDVSSGGDPDVIQFYPCNSVIIAISQGPQTNVTSTEPQIHVNDRGLVVIDESGLTTMEGVYASGDVVTGPKTVVEAQAQAKLTCNAMHNYIQNKKQVDWVDMELYPRDVLDMDMDKFAARQ